MASWRDRARPIIIRVIKEVGTGDYIELRKALREAYPFGPKMYHPYKIWLHEIGVQLGKKTWYQNKTKALAKGQRDLFKENHNVKQEPE